MALLDRLLHHAVVVQIEGAYALDAGKAEWPSLREFLLDGGFVTKRYRA